MTRTQAGPAHLTECEFIKGQKTNRRKKGTGGSRDQRNGEVRGGKRLTYDGRRLFGEKKTTRAMKPIFIRVVGSPDSGCQVDV